MLETKNNKIVQRIMMMAVLMTGLFIIGVNQAMAQSRIFNFFIQNIDSAPVTIRLETGGCYEGDIPNGEIWENVPPQGKVKILLARIQGHGCDGEAGGFYLIFSPKVGVKERVAFNFDNSGSLWIVPIANQYPGILGPKAGPSDQSYTYTTFARPKVTAGKPQGSWEEFCAGICDKTIKNEITNQTTKETTVSEENKSAISVALEAGLEFEGVGSAKTTVTASLEKTIGKSMSNSVMNSSTTSDEQKVSISLEQSETFNIHAVWRWVATTTLSNGQSYVVKTTKFTCTPDGVEPTYLPGSKEDIRSCRGKNAVSADKPQDANPKPNPVETPKPNPVETPKPTIGRQEVDVEFTTSYSPIWNDSGSGSNSNVSFWRPDITSGWSRVGHHISNGYGKPQESTMLVRPRTNGAISDPVDYTLVWNDAGSGASQDGSVWRPVCRNGYQALGDVTSSSHAKPTTTEMVCVHESALINANPGNPIWNDTGSGATKDFGSWEITPSAGDQSRGLFFGSDSHSRPQMILWAVRFNSGMTATKPPTPMPPTARINVALASNGGVASASSTIWKNVPNYPSFPEASVINGDRTGRKWGSGGGWNDETSGAFPDWLQVDFSGQKNVDEINVVTLQDGFETAGEPTSERKFTTNGIKDFVVQYWNGADWVTVPGGSVTGNDLVIRTFKFTPVSTIKIRVTVNAALQDYSRIVQFEAWGNK